MMLRCDLTYRLNVIVLKIGSLGEVTGAQTIGVLIGAALHRKRIRVGKETLQPLSGDPFVPRKTPCRVSSVSVCTWVSF